MAFRLGSNLSLTLMLALLVASSQLASCRVPNDLLEQSMHGREADKVLSVSRSTERSADTEPAAVAEFIRRKTTLLAGTSHG